MTQLEKHVPSLHAEAKVGRRCWATGVLYKHAQDVILTMCWLGYYACKQTSVSKQRGSAGPHLSHCQQPCELWAMQCLLMLRSSPAAVGHGMHCSDGRSGIWANEQQQMRLVHV